MNDQEKPKIKFDIKDLIQKLDLFLAKGKPADILIIKSHLLCEYYINQLLILREICTARELESLTFSKKLEKAFDNGKADEKLVFNSISRLNKLRNKVGHELQYTLSESDIDSLGFEQGKKYILNKYEFEEDTERLRSILENIVVDTALLFINNVRREKEKLAKELGSLDKK